MKAPGDRCPYRRWNGDQCEKEVGHGYGHTVSDGDYAWIEWGSAPSAWESVREFETDIPQRCGVCLEVMSGRELGYLPNMCLIERCPGAADRVNGTVRLLCEDTSEEVER